MDKELFLLGYFGNARLPHLVYDVNSLFGCWVNKATVHVQLNHLVRRSELRILSHGHVEWYIIAKDS